MSQYLGFVAFAALLAIAPGPDSLLTLRNTVAGGRRRGLWTTFGICTAGAAQGVLAASGLGALVAHSQYLFEIVRWAGVVYLAYLGISALRVAWRTRGDLETPATGGPALRGGPARVWWQGFLCNITNPKVLAFNLAVLPQFVGTDPAWGALLAYALTLALVGGLVLLTVVWAAGAAAAALRRRRVRRAVEGGTGIAMLGFAAALAVEG